MRFAWSTRHGGLKLSIQSVTDALRYQDLPLDERTAKPSTSCAFVFVALAWHLQSGNNEPPSIQELVRWTKLPEQKIQAALRALENHGAIHALAPRWGCKPAAGGSSSQRKEALPVSVYVIGVPGSSLVKIGKSVDPQARLRTIRHMSPVPLTVLWSTPGSQNLEQRLHQVFASLRCHGEWFDFGPQDPVERVKAETERLADVR